MKIKKETERVIVLQSILIIIGVLLLLANNLGLLNQLPLCVFREKYGIICPTCGVTRCVINFLNLNFKQALLYHPTLFVFITYVGFVDFLYIINVLLKKNFLKFLYPSLSILYIFLAMFVIQYIFRICMLVNGVGL